MMTKGSRILVLVAALALGLVYVLPVWRINLEAPQYPEGMGMVIRINTIVGVKQHDLDNINNLNHYIGMKRIEPASIPELRIMPVAVAALLLLGLLVAVSGRRKMLYTWTAAFMLVALTGMADFWKWEYNYGHDLDQEHAIIKVPGMSYQPPLIGSRQILNFRAISWPGAGGWILVVVGGLAVAVSVVERRKGRGGPAAPGVRDPKAVRSPRRTPAAAALGLLALAATQGCAAPGPRALVLGSDACEHCLMALSDEAHGAELVTRTGKIYTFDSAECLAAFLADMDDAGSVRSLWVTDFSNAPELVEAESAYYMVSPTLHSPMGGGLTAFARAEDRDGALNAFGGEPLDWSGVRARFGRKGATAAMPPHGGHTMTMPPVGMDGALHGGDGS